MNQSTCSIDGCEKLAKNSGMCWGHYTRKRRYGSPERLSFQKGRSAHERFAQNVAESDDGCIVWTGGKLTGGYGSFRFQGKSWPAHRWAWAHAIGDIPAGQVVRHKCDNPPCVNLAHLELGAPAENSMDMVVRGRSLTGSSNPHARLVESQVAQIRALLADGQRRQDVASMFGVSKPTIDQIATRKSWRHV